MKKNKLMSIILAGIVACSALTALPLSASAKYYDNNDKAHNNRDIQQIRYSNPSDRFYEKGGWKESQEYHYLYKNNKYSANLIIAYNPEMVGSEYTHAWVGTANDQTGFYMDSKLNNDGEFTYSKTRYADGFWKSTYCYKYVRNESAVTYVGCIYW